MRSKKVSEWVQSGSNSAEASVPNSAYDSDDSDAPDSVARERKSKFNSLPDPDKDWPGWLEVAERNIRSGSTKVRNEFLNGGFRALANDKGESRQAGRQEEKGGRHQNGRSWVMHA